MKKIALFFLFMILQFIDIGCSSLKSKSDVSINGSWAFLYESDSYCEAYFSNTEVYFISEIFGKSGPFEYHVIKDSLFYDGCHYAFNCISCDSIILTSTQDTLKLTKFISQSTVGDTSSYDPFYLRKFNYLVSVGAMSLSEAIEQLNLLETNDTIIEEIIPHQAK